ncbi:MULTISPECIES: sensor histidine kinase [Sporosarcina]|uniref:sensor histidine kinase n=1 Tax=Sporosarcina TaxID=1569 RepID=UPI00058C8F93|nr:MULTISPECIES: sensor histidine kinase [Sporosarcina]WJY27601.1 sensor histidine kinase [Sporosarcina sp. 0.2-SM1T-5]
MLREYIADRISWIGLYAAALLLTDLLLFLDAGLPVRMISVLYLNGLLFVVFIAFFGWRYRKETAYYRELQALAEDLPGDWLEALPAAEFNQQSVVTGLLAEIDRSLRIQLTDLQEAVSIEQTDTAAWVHEVKAPLTAMKLVIDTNRTEPAIQKIESAWLRIHLLIDQQLYISRLPSLEADYTVGDTDVIRLAAEEVRYLMPWCLERNIAVDISESPVQTVTDQKWCRFIIRQLLTNAVKYSPAGGVITIETGRDTAGRLTLSVLDEGPGIPAHEQPRIFDKGFTGSAGRIHNAATGLGLFLASRAAGKIGVGLRSGNRERGGTEMMMIFPAENEFDATRM